jgi:plastocyanin
MKIILIIALIALILIVSIYFLLPKEVPQALIENLTNETQPINKTEVIPIGKKIRIKGEVLIFSEKFEPAEINLKTNEKIKWVNKDETQHEVVCVDVTRNEALFDILINPDETWEWGFYSKGEYECWDPIVGEAKMRMKIRVE